MLLPVMAMMQSSLTPTVMTRMAPMWTRSVNLKRAVCRSVSPLTVQTNRMAKKVLKKNSRATKRVSRNEASQQLEEHEAGFNDMVATAIERGLSQDAVTRIQQEYQNEDRLSDESYKELAEAGYSKAFVDAYIRGQEALVNQYVEKVMDFVGGRERFQQVYTHMQTNNPEGAEALIKAFESRDVATMKTILNLAGQSRDKTFGKKAERSIAKRATPAKPVARKAEGFESQAEMIKAMSDPRYRTDSKYRREVEQKVIDSKF